MFSDVPRVAFGVRRNRKARCIKPTTKLTRETFEGIGRERNTGDNGVYPERVALASFGNQQEKTMGIIWTLLIGFVAGLIAKFVTPGSNEPSGFILTTILGVVGAFVATWIGQALGWYRAGEGAGLIGAVVGAVIVLFIWGAMTRNRNG
jgi:uncharacterized membrane protein YeaQ/YmgE (transglycosylase-associated protein family)